MAEDIENVVIIGNGFDLNLGLNTSFKSFFNEHKTKFGAMYNSPEYAFMNFVDKLNKNKQFVTDWYNIEKLLGDFSLKYPEHDFKNEYKKIIESLESYLNEQTYNFNPQNNYKFASQFFGMFDTESLLKTKIINFNYTNTAEILAKRIIYRIPEITYTHGKLKDANNPIIFGINDNIKISKHHSYIRKSAYTDHKLLRDFNKLKSAKNIFFFGHSLGLTDHSYFKDFFQFLLDYKYTKFLKNILFFVHDKSISEHLLFEINELTNYNITSLKIAFNIEFVEVKEIDDSINAARIKIGSILSGYN